MACHDCCIECEIACQIGYKPSYPTYGAMSVFLHRSSDHLWRGIDASNLVSAICQVESKCSCAASNIEDLCGLTRQLTDIKIKVLTRRINCIVNRNEFGIVVKSIHT